MICQKKQIQNRRLSNLCKTQPLYFTKNQSLWSKNILNARKNQTFQENFYEIDPWFIKQNPKFDEINSKISHQITLTQKEVKAQKISSIAKNEGHQSLENRKSKITGIVGSSNLVQEEITTPAKIDMIQCSIRFEQYQHQKANEIKSIFMSKILTDDKKNSIKSSKKANFIERNIKLAFQIDNRRNQRAETFQKQRTIEQTKDQLIRNKEKLPQESKEIFRVISMKDQKLRIRPRPKSQTQNYEKNMVSSIWNLSYIQNSLNPEMKKNRKRHSAISQWKKVLKNKGKSEGLKADLSSQKNEAKKASLLQQNQKNEKNMSSRRILTSSDSRSLTKRLARIWKAKSKSTITISSTQEKNFHENRPKSCDAHYNTIIYSSNFQGKKGESPRNSPKEEFQSLEPENFTEFENMAISQVFGSKNDTKLKGQLPIKSLTTRQSRHNFPQREKGMKIKPHQTEKRLMTKNFCIEGSTCEFNQLFNG